jgi:hypothetical protein
MIYNGSRRVGLTVLRWRAAGAAVNLLAVRRGWPPCLPLCWPP